MAGRHRRLVPGIVAPILVLDGSCRHLLRRAAVEAGDVDGEEGAAQRVVMAAPERLDAATPAKEMVNVSAAELVIGEFGLAVQDAKIVLACDRLPEPALGADGTVAAARAFCRIEPAFERTAPQWQPP